MVRFVVVLTLCAACGPPIARNIPQPNKAAAAGIAAGAAAALTLADPNAAAKKQEEKKTEAELREQNVETTVPADVLDRLDAQQARQPRATEH
jgi:hypothetical protein